MPVNFDLNDLARALLEYGNFRLAAESICLSQSALSRRIEKLEAALGTKLFDRTTRRVTLTLYGAASLPTDADSCLLMRSPCRISIRPARSVRG